ncbi:MAG TPA: hypothetical protein VGI66_06435 [Streptosporangiaceae bacterium]|jgi:hypothetical protein
MSPPAEQLIRDYINRLSVAARGRLRNLAGWHGLLTFGRADNAGVGFASAGALPADVADEHAADDYVVDDSAADDYSAEEDAPASGLAAIGFGETDRYDHPSEPVPADAEGRPAVAGTLAGLIPAQAPAQPEPGSHGPSWPHVPAFRRGGVTPGRAVSPEPAAISAPPPAVDEASESAGTAAAHKEDLPPGAVQTDDGVEARESAEAPDGMEARESVEGAEAPDGMEAPKSVEAQQIAVGGEASGPGEMLADDGVTVAAAGEAVAGSGADGEFATGEASRPGLVRRISTAVVTWSRQKTPVVVTWSRRKTLAVATWSRRNPQESVATILLGVGGLIFPPVWFLGAAVALASKVWDGHDKWVGLAVPILLTIVGTAAGVILAGSRLSLDHYVHVGWLSADIASRVSAVLSAAYLAWRSVQGRRPAPVLPRNKPHRVG